jgi:outer membrane protein assembly factor BamB
MSGSVAAARPEGPTMHRPLAVLALAALSAAAPAQTDIHRTFSNPVPPSREALDRLMLKQAWQVNVPMDGRRDGFLSINLSGPHLLVQTRSGLVACYDSANGRLLWETRVGRAYANTVPLGFNSFAVLYFNNGELFALDRQTGHVLWSYDLPGALALAPVADENQLYLVSANRRVFAFRFPPVDLGGRRISAEAIPGLPGYAPKGDSREPQSVERRRPIAVWVAPARGGLDMAPQLGGDVFLLPSGDGGLQALARRAFDNVATTEPFRWNAEGRMLAPPTTYEDMAYVGSTDGNVYALSLAAGRVAWRYTAGTAISRSPVALARQVFAVSEGQGLACLDRATGDPVWKLPYGRRVVPYNAEADRFLAANPKFVYALDRSGRLLVLDRARGTTLSVLDVRDFVVPYVNDRTDRLLLAANNGMILCLHDRDYAEPFEHRKEVTPRSTTDVSRMPVDPKTQDELKRKLNQQVSIDKDSLPMPLPQALRQLETQFNVRFMLADNAYRDQRKIELMEKPVVIEAAQNKPLKEVIQRVLDQADSTYVIFGQILVAPKGDKKPDKPPEPMPEKKPDEKMPDKPPEKKP